MLRSGDSLRLTPTERETFETLVADGLGAPTTVQEHDVRVDSAAGAWHATGDAEGLLLAALATDLRVEPAPAGAKLSLVRTPLEALRDDVSTLWELDARALTLPEMLTLAVAAGDTHRDSKVPGAAKVFDELAQDIRTLQATGA